MALRLVQTLAHRFGAVVAVAVLVGVFAPGVAVAVAPALMGCLMAMFALSFMITDLALLREELVQWPRLSWLMLFVIVARAATAYFVARVGASWLGVPQDWALPVLLLYACPPAGVTPTLALLFGARFERTLFATTLTTLAAPLLVPALLAVFVGGALLVDSTQMAADLSLLILAPLGLAVLARIFVPSRIESLRPYVPGASTGLLFFILVGAMGSTRGGMGPDAGWAEFAGPIGFTTLVMLCVSLVGWLAAGWRADRADRLSLALLSAWPNIGLAAVLGAQLFGDTRPDLLLVLAASVLPWSLALGPARWLATRGATAE